MRDKLLSYFIIVVTCMGCSENRKGITENFTANKHLDSIITTYMAELRTDPEKVRQSIDDTLKTVDDSLSYYKLSTVLFSYHFYGGHYDSAAVLAGNALNFLNRQEDSAEKNMLHAKVLNNMGVTYSVMSQRDSAIYYYKQAINAYLQIENHSTLPTIYINMADAYNLKGDYANAASTYRQALTYVDSLPSGARFKHAIYNGLGRIYTDIQNFPMADFYFNLVENDWENVSDFNRYFFSNSRSTYYYNIKEYQKSLYWLDKALEAVRKLNSPFDQAVVEANLGEIYLLLHQTDSAKHYLDKAASVFFSPAIKDPSTEYYLNGLFASYYLQTDNLNRAEHLLTMPYDLTRITPNYVYYNDKRLEELHQRKGNYRQAYIYRKKTDMYDDSVRNMSIQNNISEMELRYRQDTTLLRRDVMIANQQKQVEQMRATNMLAVTCLVIVVLVFTILILYLRRKKEKRFARQMDTITTLRMDNLRNRVSPHFIYNVLHTVLPTLQQQTEASPMLELLNRSVRDSLLTSGKVAISLEEEISIVKNYIRLRESTGSIPAKVEWHIAQEVNTDTFVPSMIIQIPVENALKYAFEHQNEANMISIQIDKDVKSIRLMINDNGVGFNPTSYSTGQKGTGNGIKILYKTIELLNERNNEKIVLSINSTPHSGTKVSIAIPTNYKYTL